MPFLPNFPERQNEFWKYVPLKKLMAEAPPPSAVRPAFEEHLGDIKKFAEIHQKAAQHLPDSYSRDLVTTLTGFGQQIVLNRDGLNKIDISNDQNKQLKVVIVQRSCDVLIDSVGHANASERLKNLIFIIEPNVHVKIMWKTLCTTVDIELNYLQIFLRRNAEAGLFILSSGGRLQKSFIQFVHEEPGSKSHLHSLSICRGQSIIDHHTFVHHLVGECSTEHIEKSIVSDSAKFIFHGRVRIEQDAQKADCSQLNHNLIEDDTAEVNSTPQLEILADDVKAAHGFALGEIQEDEIFYLQSRGLPRTLARQLLKTAYAKELATRIDSPELRNLALVAIDDLMQPGEAVHRGS